MSYKGVTSTKHTIKGQRGFLTGQQLLSIALFIDQYVQPGKKAEAKEALFSIIKDEHRVFKEKVFNKLMELL